MLTRFLPRYVDNNTYRGYTIALWIFGAVVFFKAGISANSILNPYTVASSADGIPLNTFPAAAVQTVVSDFAIWGVAFLTICFICAVVLVRYRALVPFMFAVLLAEQLARKLILYLLPAPIAGSPPGFIVNLVLITLMVIGLILSLLNRESLAPAAVNQ